MRVLTRAVPVSAIAEDYPVSMIRIDVEGYEYKILGGRIPSQIETICMELHKPYGIPRAVRFLNHLRDEGLEDVISINGMMKGYYPMIKHIGLNRTYKITRALKGADRTTSKHGGC